MPYECVQFSRFLLSVSLKWNFATNCTLAMRHHTVVLSTYTGCLLILFITRLRNITIRPPALLSYELLSTLYQLEKKSFSCPCLFSLYHFNGCYISHCFNTLYQVLHINWSEYFLHHCFKAFKEHWRSPHYTHSNCIIMNGQGCWNGRIYSTSFCIQLLLTCFFQDHHPATKCRFQFGIFYLKTSHWLPNWN